MEELGGSGKNMGDWGFLKMGVFLELKEILGERERMIRRKIWKLFGIWVRLKGSKRVWL